MKSRSIIFVALVCVVVIALTIFEGARLIRNSARSQDAGAAAQAQGAQNGGNAPTYH